MTSVFTTSEFARTCGISEERAKTYLEGFEQAGVVERKLRTGWVATPRGLRLSRSLALVSPQRREAA